MTEGSTFQKNLIILNVYAANSRASNYVRPKLIELPREIDETIISDMCDLSTALRNGQTQNGENQ